MKKIILSIMSCFLFIAAAISQEIRWQKTIGGSKVDEFTALAKTSDGGCICGGFSPSDISGNKTENNCNINNIYSDYWIVKLDSAGNIQWQNDIGGTSFDELYSISQTADGGYICGGKSISTISCDKNEPCLSAFYYDYWVIKLNAAGNIQWQNDIGGFGNDDLQSIIQTSDGGYICGGTSNSNIGGDKTENSKGSSDYWIVKLDASGNIQWQKTIGGSEGDQMSSIVQTDDGGYVCGGNSLSDISGDKTEDNWDPFLFTCDLWVVKLDATGNIQWQNTIGGTKNDALTAIVMASNGGFICAISSESDSTGDKTEANRDSISTSSDYWVVKLDSLGSIQNQKTIGGTNNDMLNSIAITTDEGYVCGGRSASNISGDKTMARLGAVDYWIVKLDSTFSIQWQNVIGGSKDNILTSIIQTTDGDYICGGWSNSNISGYKTENCWGGYDYWVVKLTDKFNLINGKLFIDANSNLLQDAGEPDITNKTINEFNTGRFNFSNQNGEYLVSVLDSGNFSVSPSSINYYIPVPANHTAYFPGINQTDSLNDFAFQPAGAFNDLCVTISAMGNFRANMTANYMINYENVGTTTLNGTVIFFPDNDITYSSSNVTPTSVTTDSVVWNVGTLTPFQTGSILVTVNVNAGTPIGTQINSSVEIDPVAGDANMACNYADWQVFATGSYDPNAILVDRDTVLTTELSSPPYLNYIIYFQNTGNDTAFNVRVLNNIPQMLDVNSFEFVSSSHPMNITYGAHARLMTFTFDNILLPDSNVNEPGSHGFIRYRIKPFSTLVAGDSIKNNAAIYFDFNQPVMTDTAVTEIVLPVGIAAAGNGSKQLVVYPNPVREELIIKSDLLSGKKAEVKVYDLFGRKVFQLQTASCKLQTQINVSHFSQGIYFVEVQSGELVLRGKFLKE